MISVDVEKAIDKTQHSFIIKILSKLGIKENFLNLIKSICFRAKSFLEVKD